MTIDDEDDAQTTSNPLRDRIIWRNRDYLPHTFGHKRAQLVTFSLRDALTPHLIGQRTLEVQAARAEKGAFIDESAARGIAIDDLLDEGIGSRTLGDPDSAAMVEADVLHFHRIRYRLHSWVVMPNHVHVLLTPSEGSSIGEIVGSWKNHSAQRINRRLGRRGPLWQREYFDRFIRDPEHFRTAVAYIERNPVKATLCNHPPDWPFSSSRWRGEDGRLVLPHDDRS
jgi:REP element-mobilizing transposase RayT